MFRPYPLADQSVDAVLNMFAPRNPGEFHRVLRPNGSLIVVRPTVDHLAELRIDVDAITEQLQTDGVAAFAKSFDSLLATIAAKREALTEQ